MCGPRTIGSTWLDPAGRSGGGKLPRGRRMETTPQNAVIALKYRRRRRRGQAVRDRGGPGVDLEFVAVGLGTRVGVTDGGRGVGGESESEARGGLTEE